MSGFQKLDLALTLFISCAVHLHAQISFPQDIRNTLASADEGKFDQSNVICISNQLGSDALGKSNSHFGMSVRLVVNEGRGSASWIFIGDPRGNSTDPSYRNGRRNTNEPGVVWRCSLGKLSKESCQIMHLDPDPSNARVQQACTPRTCEDFPNWEQRDLSWVGGVIESNSNRFITCGHRRRDTDTSVNDPSLHGICYWFNQNSMYQSWDSTLNDLNIDLTTYNHRLLPLYESPNTIRAQGGFSNQLFYLSGQKGSLVDWTFGETGMSLHLTNNNELLIGAPGVRLWTGSVIIYHDADIRDIRVNKDRLNRGGGREFAKYTVVKRESPRITGRHYYEYFGYAVTSGRYLAGIDDKVYVAGAPRARVGRPLLGQVVLFRLPFQATFFQDFEAPIVEIKTFSGDQVGAYFGSVLLSTDVTGDRFDELLVGAPFYNVDWISVRAKREGSDRTGRADDFSFQTYSRFGDHGRVYVYSYGRNGLEPTTYVLQGSNSPGARFGSAMVSLGDINEDFLNDVAIGAPYENDGEGAVYIFYGQANLNSWKWSEKISPQKYESLLTPSNSFRGFGISLASNVDIDGNSLQDLSIGSYLSKQVFIFRTRPTIKIEGRIRILGENGRPIQTVPATTSFTKLIIESCVRFSGVRASDSLPMEVTVWVDSRFGIVQDVGESTGSPRVKLYHETVARDYKCTKFEAEANKIIEVDESDERAEPVQIEQFVNYKGLDTSNTKLYHYKIVEGRNERPSLDFSSSGPIDFQQFCPRCPFPTSGKTSADFEIASECEDPSNCKPELAIQSWFTLDGKKINSLELDWSKRITLHITVANSGEPAYNPKISIQWESSTDKEFKPKIHSKPVECSDELACTLGKSLKANKPAKELQIDFDLSGFYASKVEHLLKAEISCSTGSALNPIATSQISLGLNPEFHLELNGVQSKSIEFDRPFIQEYSLNIEGPSFPSAVVLTFRFPIKRMYEGVKKEILVVAPPRENYNCTVEPNTGHFTDSVKFLATKNNVFPGTNFNESAKDTIISRQRRQASETGENQRENRRNLTILEFSCENAEIDCMIVHCTVSKSSRKLNTFTFVMSLAVNASASFQETVNTVVIRSQGSGSSFDGSSFEANAETVLQKSSALLHEPNEVPLWIYIVGGVGGFIILAIIIAILYWRGFFRRDKKEQLEQLKVQAGIQDHLLAANQRAPSFQEAQRDDAFE